MQKLSKERNECHKTTNFEVIPQSVVYTKGCLVKNTRLNNHKQLLILTTNLFDYFQNQNYQNIAYIKPFESLIETNIRLNHIYTIN